MSSDDKQYNLLPSESMTVVNPNSVYSGASICNSSVYINQETSRLLFATKKGDIATMQRLIKEIGVNASDYDRRTALHIACAEGKIVPVQLLLDSNADPNAVDRFGGTPLDDAVREGSHPEICKLLVSRGAMLMTTNSSAREWELIQACSKGEMDRVRSLVNAKVDLQCSDYDLRTPLHLAAAEGRVEVVAYLISQGARVDVEDRWGSTPLMEAKQRGAAAGGEKLLELLGPRKSTESAKMSSQTATFAMLLGLCEVIIVILFGIFSTYGEGANHEVAQDDGLHAYWMDIHVMIFIGFGYLMTFLRRYGYTSVGYTMMIAAFAMQWYTLCNGFWHCVFTGHWEKIPLNRHTLMVADFCAGAVLITYGALIGKVSHLQLLIITIVEVMLYSINEEISLKLKVTDIGGTMVIHMFGAYFGLACSWVVSPAAAHDDPNNSSVYHSDLFAMIGTVFLWLFWPSFNGGPGVNNSQHRAVVNTLYSLTGSCCAVFVMSCVLRAGKKFNMVDIQNATLAGGVAMGTCADLFLGNPGAALAIGIIAGTVSAIGFVIIQPFLAKTIGLHDTCGVNNLHGMPSIIGAFAGVIAVSFASKELYGETLAYSLPAIAEEGRTASSQSGLQVAFIGITLAIGLIGGLLTGRLVKGRGLGLETMFVDSEGWDIPETEIPFYFDNRAENSRNTVTLMEYDHRLKELELWKLTSSATIANARRQSTGLSLFSGKEGSPCANEASPSCAPSATSGGGSTAGLMHQGSNVLEVLNP